MRSVELFAGCGGLAYGIAEAGFDHVMVIERDENACATLEFNKQRGVRHFSSWPIISGDVRDVDFRHLKGTVDLLSGGPPCQPFSIGGKHNGPKDERNMWPEAMRAVREIQPKAFLFENVRGLLRPAFADYVEFLKLQLTWPQTYSSDVNWRVSLKTLKGMKDKSPSYHVVIRGINAADYGAPQKRHRAIVMGIRSDVAAEVRFPVATHSQAALVYNQRIGADYWERHDVAVRTSVSWNDRSVLEKLRKVKMVPAEEPWVTVRDAVVGLPRPVVKGTTVKNHELHTGARAYAGHTGSVLDEPAKALKAGYHGVPGGENALVIGKQGNVRYFTIREMMRLQGLPDEFAMDCSWMSSIKQLGNAVPTQIGKVFGESLAAQIKEGKKKSKRLEHKSRPAARVKI